MRGVAVATKDEDEDEDEEAPLDEASSPLWPRAFSSNRTRPSSAPVTLAVSAAWLPVPPPPPSPCVSHAITASMSPVTVASCGVGPAEAEERRRVREDRGEGIACGLAAADAAGAFIALSPFTTSPTAAVAWLMKAARMADTSWGEEEGLTDEDDDEDATAGGEGARASRIIVRVRAGRAALEPLPLALRPLPALPATP